MIDELDELDDLAAVRGIRAHVPGPDPDTTTRARDRVRAGMAGGPAAPRAAATTATGRRTRRAAWSPRRLGVAAGLAVVATALAIAAPSALPGRDDPLTGGADAPTRAFLLGAAAAAERQPAAAPDTGAFWYAHSRVGEPTLPPGKEVGEADGPLKSFDREVWQGRDLPGRITGIAPDNGSADIDKGEFFLGGDALSWDQLVALRPDPAALKRRLVNGVQADIDHSPDAQVFDSVRQLLTESPAPPALRGALYRVLASLPEVKVLGPAKDAEGRPGTLLALDDKGEQFRVLIDPHDGTLLEETSSRDGRLTFMATRLEAGPVDHLGDRP